MKVKYYKCMHCGNIIEKIDDKGVGNMLWRAYAGT